MSQLPEADLRFELAPEYTETAVRVTHKPSKVASVCGVYPDEGRNRHTALQSLVLLVDDARD